MINRVIPVSSIHFYDTWSVYCVVCPPHNMNHLSPCIWLPLPFTTPYPFPSGHHHAVICVYLCELSKLKSFRQYSAVIVTQTAWPKSQSYMSLSLWPLRSLYISKLWALICNTEVIIGPCSQHRRLHTETQTHAHTSVACCDHQMREYV